MMLIINNVKFKYDKEEILKDVSLISRTNEFLTIIGPNGSGKTTFLKCINRIHKIHSGNIEIVGQNINNLSQKQISQHIAYVPQMTNNFFSGTVIDLLVMGVRENSSWQIKDTDINKCLNTLDEMGILELADKNFSSLSGGQKQKVLIVKALVQDAKIYLLDEPTSFLDIKSQIDTMKIAKNLANKGKLVIMVVHDLNMAMRYSDRILLMQNGQVKAIGTPKQVLNKINIKNVYDVDVDIRENYIIPV